MDDIKTRRSRRRLLLAAAAGFGVTAARSQPVADRSAMAQRPGDWISVRDFGAAGDGVADDTKAIQAAIDWAIYQGKRARNALGRVHIPAGAYKVSDTIHLGYGASYSSVILEGEGQKYRGAHDFCGTAIVPTFNDRPCIAIQGARDSIVRGISVVGPMMQFAISRRLGAMEGAVDGIDDTAPESWVDPSFPRSASSQHAPFAGIAIDPYAGARPDVHYPDVAYPNFLGTVPQYGKGYSSNVMLDDVEIAGFVVGLAVQPCDADGNGDYTKLHRCRISQCQYGISIGNPQSRLVHVLDSVIVQCHTGITTVTHGRRRGKPAILFQSCELGAIIQWIEATNLAYGGGPKFESCYGETIWMLGRVGGSRGAGTITFSQCEFNFNSRHRRGEPQCTLVNSGPGMVAFDGCLFCNATGDPSRLHFGGTAAQYRILGCDNMIPRNASRLFEKFAINATCAITFDRLSTDGVDFSMYSGFSWNVDDGSQAASRYYSSERDGARRDSLLCVYARNACEMGSPGNPGSGMRVVPGPAIVKSGRNLSTAGRVVTFDTGLPAQALIQRGGEAGDCAWDDATGTLFYVRSRDGSKVVMEAQTNYTAAGSMRVPITSAGHFYFLNCRGYTTSRFLQGDTTEGSGVVSRAGRDDGGGFSDADIAVGDFVAVSEEVDNCLETAGEANRIVARDGKARTFTVAGKFRQSRTAQRFALFWRAPPRD